MLHAGRRGQVRLGTDGGNALGQLFRRQQHGTDYDRVPRLRDQPAVPVVRIIPVGRVGVARRSSAAVPFQRDGPEGPVDRVVGADIRMVGREPAGHQRHAVVRARVVVLHIDVPYQLGASRQKDQLGARVRSGRGPDVQRISQGRSVVQTGEGQKVRDRLLLAALEGQGLGLGRPRRDGLYQIVEAGRTVDSLVDAVQSDGPVVGRERRR